MFVLKIIHVLKDTNYWFYGFNGMEYTGFTAYLKCEELEFVWYLALAAILCSLVYLFIWPRIRKNKDSVD